jgi:hypothetical protein
MDQFNQIDDTDPFFSPPPPSLPPTDTSDALALPVPLMLALPPLATYPSKEALLRLFRAGQSRVDTPLL